MNIGKGTMNMAGNYWTLKAKAEKLPNGKARAAIVRKVRAIESAIYEKAFTV